LLAEALLVQGHARLSLDRSTAVDVLAQAATLSMRAGMDAMALEAWARHIYAKGLSSGTDPAPGDLTMMTAFAERNPSLEFERALLYNNLGGIAQSASDRAGARANYEKAVTLYAALGAPRDHGGLELMAARANLALVTDDRAAADALFKDATKDFTDLLGDNHPRTLDVRWMRGTNTIEPLSEAVAFLAPLCEASQQHPPSQVRAARCWTEVGYLYLDLARDDAGAAFVRASRSSPAAQSSTLALVALFHDREPRRAEAAFASAIASNRAKTQPGSVEAWWDKVSRAVLLLGLGRALRDQGKLRDASSALDEAAALMEIIVESHPGTRHERLLGRTRVELALALSSLRRSPSEIKPVATAAAAWLRKVGGNEGQLSLLSKLSE
jgi:tetratricopeptide (TPR) repeat protein